MQNGDVLSDDYDEDGDGDNNNGKDNHSKDDNYKEGDQKQDGHISIWGGGGLFVCFKMFWY